MNAEKNILIAGATGFVGQALVKYLLDKGYRVKVLTRNIEHAFHIFGSLVAILKWPGQKELMLLPESRNCEAFINLAGENIGAMPWSPLQKERIQNSRIDSILRISDLINKMQFAPKVWIQASAIGYYGYNTLNVVDEKSEQGKGFLAEVVGKLEHAFNMQNLPLTRKVILRFGVVMSKQGGFLKDFIEVFQMGIGICPGKGLNHISFIHINDLVRAIEFALENNKIKGAVNVVAPKSISMLNLVKLLIKHCKARFIVKIPSFLLSIFIGRLKTRELILANQKVNPKVLIAQGFQYHFPDFSYILD